MEQHPLENLAQKFQALKALSLSPEERRAYPQWVEYLALRKQGHFPLPAMFNGITDADLRNFSVEQMAMANRVPPSLRQPTVEQERLRQGYVHRYALACMRLLLPVDDAPYPEFADDVAALRAYRKRHPLPAIPKSDDDRRLLEQFLLHGRANKWEQ